MSLKQGYFATIRATVKVTFYICLCSYLISICPPPIVNSLRQGRTIFSAVCLASKVLSNIIQLNKYLLNEWIWIHIFNYLRKKKIVKDNIYNAFFPHLVQSDSRQDTKKSLAIPFVGFMETSFTLLCEPLTVALGTGKGDTLLFCTYLISGYH